MLYLHARWEPFTPPPADEPFAILDLRTFDDIELSWNTPRWVIVGEGFDIFSEKAHAVDIKAILHHMTRFSHHHYLIRTQHPKRAEKAFSIMSIPWCTGEGNISLEGYPPFPLTVDTSGTPVFYTYESKNLRQPAHSWEQS